MPALLELGGSNTCFEAVFASRVEGAQRAPLLDKGQGAAAGAGSKVSREAMAMERALVWDSEA